MRRTLFTFALTSLITLGTAGSVALAQDQSAPPSQAPSQGGYGGHHHMDPDQQLKHMTKQLDLTTDQQSQIKPLLEARQQQMEQVRQDQSMSNADRHQKMMGIQQDTSSKIEAVLNDTQKQKYEAMQAQMKQRAMQHEQGGAPSPDATPQQPPQ